MNIFHPRVLQRLMDQLPTGTKIVTCDSESNSLSTTLTVDVHGEQQHLSIPKVLLYDHLNATEVTLMVEEGQSITSVIEMFSQKYNLFWMADQDYSVNESVVVFDEQGAVFFDLVVNPRSPFWSGRVMLKLVNKADHVRPAAPVVVPTDHMRINLALTSKIFQGDGKVFNKDKTKLTAPFARKVYGYLKELGITTLGPDEIGNAELIDVVTDGFSGMVVSKPKKGPHLFIRFRSKGEDMVPASPGDLDPV